MNLIRASAALHCPTPPGHISSAHQTGKAKTKVWMNVATHQENEKNEITVKRKAGENRPISKRLRATLLRSFRGLHGEKMVCVRGVPGVTETLGKANSHFDPTQTGRGTHHHVEPAVDWCSSILLALHVHNIYTTEISHFTIQKDRSQYVF